VDLTVNDHVKETLLREQNVQRHAFFNDRGYLEVETPVLQPIPGGAAARHYHAPQLA
jgi:lysyl-tRNA synthetase class 2